MPNLDDYLRGHDGLSSIDLICRIQHWASNEADKDDAWFQQDHPDAWLFLCSNLAYEPAALAPLLPGLPQSAGLEDIMKGAAEIGITLPYLAQRKWAELKAHTNVRRAAGTLSPEKLAACDQFNKRMAELR